MRVAGGAGFAGAVLAVTRSSTLVPRFRRERRMLAWRVARAKRHAETVRFSDRKRFDQQPEFWSPPPRSGVGCATAAMALVFGS
jgi:hypothetical protein